VFYNPLLQPGTNLLSALVRLMLLRGLQSRLSRIKLIIWHILHTVSLFGITLARCRQSVALTWWQKSYWMFEWQTLWLATVQTMAFDIGNLPIFYAYRYHQGTLPAIPIIIYLTIHKAFFWTFNTDGRICNSVVSSATKWAWHTTDIEPSEFHFSKTEGHYNVRRCTEQVWGLLLFDPQTV